MGTLAGAIYDGSGKRTHRETQRQAIEVHAESSKSRVTVTYWNDNEVGNKNRVLILANSKGSTRTTKLFDGSEEDLLEECPDDKLTRALELLKEVEQMNCEDPSVKIRASMALAALKPEVPRPLAVDEADNCSE